MRVSKTNRVIITTTNYIHGCLEQGGRLGKIDSYDINDVAAIIGCKPDQVASYGLSTTLPAYYGQTIRDIIVGTLVPRVVRHGQLIE